MAQRRRSAQEPVQEPVKADEIVAEVSELDFIEVSEADVSENETFASEADSVTDEEEKAPIEAVSDESVVEETGEVNVTFSGMKDLQARVPNKIQVVIPLDGTPADDPDAVITFGHMLQFIPGQTLAVEPEEKAWLLNHLAYKFT